MGAGRNHFADYVQVQLPGGPLPFFAGRNLRPEFLVQGVGFFLQLKERQRIRQLQHGIRNLRGTFSERHFPLTPWDERSIF